MLFPQCQTVVFPVDPGCPTSGYRVKIVRAPGDVLVRRDRAVSAQHNVEIGSLARGARTGRRFEAGHGDRPRIGEAVEVIRRRGVSARNVHHDIGIDEVRHQAARGSVACLADTIFVRYAVGDVVAVGPHAEDRRIPDRLRPLWGCLRGYVHFVLVFRSRMARPRAPGSTSGSGSTGKRCFSAIMPGAPFRTSRCSPGPPPSGEDWRGGLPNYGIRGSPATIEA